MTPRCDSSDVCGQGWLKINHNRTERIYSDLRQSLTRPKRKKRWELDKNVLRCWCKFGQWVL